MYSRNNHFCSSPKYQLEFIGDLGFYEKTETPFFLSCTYELFEFTSKFPKFQEKMKKRNAAKVEIDENYPDQWHVTALLEYEDSSTVLPSTSTLQYPEDTLTDYRTLMMNPDVSNFTEPKCQNMSSLYPDVCFNSLN